ncbi:MAG TPA: hypothetical protein VLL52_04160 [Anaerolineae bacterium]|nr:hypothetical protein [Anaerolineae bacterium]
MQHTYKGQQTANSVPAPTPQHLSIGLILIIALIAFEIFNFDTTQFALTNLLGTVSFAGVSWATILAIAFCAIDFSGLVHLFTPEKGREEPKEVWFLMGAWLLGATLNAGMTWWAVSLALLDHPHLGNEVLTRAQLLQGVPVFVAGLVWLTRILFIGSISIAAEQLFAQPRPSTQQNTRLPNIQTTRQPIRAPQTRPQMARPAQPTPTPTPKPITQPALPSRTTRRPAPIQFELPQTDALPTFLQRQPAPQPRATTASPTPPVVRPQPQRRRANPA